MTDTARYALVESVIHQTVANETVIINLENGRYYSLNPTGSVIWEALMHEANAAEIAQTFPAPENPDPVNVLAAVERFIDELIAEDLLTPAPPNTSTPSVDSSQRSSVPFETPQLTKFTDMEDLIPLDPIHQVGTLGWPHRIQDGPDQAT